MHRSGSSGRGIPQPYAFRGEDMPRKPLEGSLRPAMRGIARWQRAAGFSGQGFALLFRNGYPHNVPGGTRGQNQR